MSYISVSLKLQIIEEHLRGQMIKVLLDGTRIDIFSIDAVALIPRCLIINGNCMKIQQIIPNIQFFKRLLAPIISHALQI
jgi:hypothetical protein